MTPILVHCAPYGVGSDRCLAVTGAVVKMADRMLPLFGGAVATSRFCAGTDGELQGHHLDVDTPGRERLW